jgi:hypothetical protein
MVTGFVVFFDPPHMVTRFMGLAALNLIFYCLLLFHMITGYMGGTGWRAAKFLLVLASTLTCS